MDVWSGLMQNNIGVHGRFVENLEICWIGIGTSWEIKWVFIDPGGCLWYMEDEIENTESFKIRNGNDTLLHDIMNWGCHVFSWHVPLTSFRMFISLQKDSKNSDFESMRFYIEPDFETPPLWGPLLCGCDGLVTTVPDIPQRAKALISPLVSHIRTENHHL